jgi:hypothetical protein
MNKETTFYVNSAIDFSENGSYSLVDSSLNNNAMVVITDEKVKVYFENGDPEMDFGTDYQCLVDYANENNLTFVKLMSGDKRWKEFNPNPKERNIGDCTLRSYCAAFGISWDKAFDIASRVAKENSSMIQYVADKVLVEEFNCVVDEKYNKKTVKSKDRIKVNEFALSHPYGTYILHVPKHQVTVVNGEYWDSWDSGDKKIDTVYIVPKKK